MICNIVDERDRPHRWRKVNATVENARHDNSVRDGDVLDEVNPDATPYDERFGIALHDAMFWAESMPGKVTLYLSDRGRS